MSDAKFKNPFRRPWMTEYGAAAPAEGAKNTSLKGIVAGEYQFCKWRMHMLRNTVTDCYSTMEVSILHEIQ